MWISRIKGIEAYIFIDDNGKVITHDMKAPQKISHMVFSCGRRIAGIGKNRFRYASFSRKSKKNILIFPVGNYYLGVIKKKDVDTHVLADTILNCINEVFQGGNPD